MKIYQPNSLTIDVLEQLRELWNAEYPKTLQYSNVADFQTYISGLESVKHSLVREGDKLMAWYFDFERTGSRWFGLVISEDYQGSGLGTTMLNKAKEEHEELNGWVILSSNLQKSDGGFYLSPLKFYEKSGFETLEQSTLDVKDIEVVHVRWSKST